MPHSINAELREAVCKWLRANGIDPHMVPEGCRPTTADDTVTLQMWLLNDRGRVQLDPNTHRPAETTATFAVTVQPPALVAEWLRPRCPECGR